MSESDWLWVFDGFQKEMTQMKRRDGEEELEYQDRAALYFLEASCPDWYHQRKEIARALVDAFNLQSPPIDYKAFF
ncbi:hypothetical protein AS149_28320 [Burkholderia cenocepacia]|nr:hypothetical protein AS149_28320 [Burkholderia cenocepacia]